MTEEEKLLLIEFRNDAPFLVYTNKNEYSVEESAALPGYFMRSLVGSVRKGAFHADCFNGPVWAAPDVTIIGTPVHGLSREPILDEDGFPVKTLDDADRHFVMEEVNGLLYDKVAQGFYDRDRGSPYTFWCSEWGVFAGPGSDECSTKAHRPYVMELVRKLDCLNDLKAALESGDFEIVINNYMLYQTVTALINGVNYSKQIEEALEDGHEIGFGWLYCLKPGKTIEAIQETLRWLQDEVET